MKRKPKPFSVEIKKSRTHGQRHQLAPTRLFALTPAQAPTIVQKEEPQAIAQPAAAPRILASILEPVWSNSEVVEPIRRKGTSRSKLQQRQIEFDLTTISSKGAIDAPTDTPVMPEVLAQAGAPSGEEGASPIPEDQVQEPESTKTKPRKPRKKASKIVDPVIEPEPLSQPEAASETQGVGALPVNRSPQTDHRRHTRREAAAQLPRQERWKRRLHSAAW
ncbi:hypothetical protein [Microvirga sp. TS319]|uniref:hypothetical protein n=1 Tax=Microvirga sp. TS319 TaxID=3241165 RepID=UPI00351A1A58